MKREKVAVYISLLASVLLLLSVVIPHHHHADGMPCYRYLVEMADDVSGRADSPHPSLPSHDCGCIGHNQALFPSLEHHAVALQYLVPLLVLFDYINPPEVFSFSLPYEKQNAFYIETLHDSWVAKAAGLRAPPFSPLG